MDFISVMAKKNPTTPKHEGEGDEDDTTSTVPSTTTSKANTAGTWGKGGQFVKPNFHIMLEMKDSYTVEILRNRHKSQVIR